MNIKSHIPNSITLLNLLSGLIGIIWVFEGNYQTGAYFIFLSALLDFFDGFAARLLKVQGELGKQLDSLADVVSFGVLPGLILFKMCGEVATLNWLPYLTLIIPLFSAYRLAKFNIDSRQSEQFIGLPTPANALFFSTLPFLKNEFPFLENYLNTPWLLVVFAWVFSILLIAELPLIALKFKSFSFRSNEFRFVLLGLGLASILVFGVAGIPPVILLYIGLSLLENLKSQK
ncbi:CDP-diacylglycerol--serine O-phosphatidyltransferase [Algoriphagus sp. CAU 1675]|uniref:CDP-diacylglycerol--serine O-phosphatidyltransferase n=1 Tax=Algoriphagus sp. CAU 1675 TaxID=3032597 RepID=UPI0023DCDF2D|nr:CDP-diacylglycerol--serine O-phosphatidyltransferase [Algoriphagus sp. CAU 1675]MDF2157146.1 CDP-diacylglycerol--serine O-phosphatidyltransferase [Algoriphagus sp. CAU 1675]